jgi:hypothetical protein
MHSSEPVSAAFVLREFLKGVTDDYIRRPLWEFPFAEQKAVRAERRRRFGAPADEWEFDPEYH